MPETQHPPITLSCEWSRQLRNELLRRQLDDYVIACWPSSEDWKSLVAAISVGIDSHLEVVMFKADKDERGAPRFSIDRKSLPTLVRRLLEGDGWLEADFEVDPETLDDWQRDLACGICHTLGIELM